LLRLSTEEGVIVIPTASAPETIGQDTPIRRKRERNRL